MKSCDHAYPPVTRFERRTGECPLYVAQVVLDEVRNYYWLDLPEALADELAVRAETVFAKNARWRKRIQGRHGRAYLEMFMRHWLSSALRKRRSPLFRELPDSFKFGGALPVISSAREISAAAKPTRRRLVPSPRRHFVHGGELLASFP